MDTALIVIHGPMPRKLLKKVLERSFIKKKAQSAMEYLMTYGWAILIIAVVLGALFSLGVFNGSSFFPTACVAQSGYYCQNPILSTNGVLSVTVGQNINQMLTNVNVYFVPYGSSLSNAAGVSIGTLQSGQIVNVNIQLPTGPPYPYSYNLGTSLTGYIYMSYTEYGMVQEVEIATVTAKASSSSVALIQAKSTTIPSGISTYVPITLTNSQTSNTPSPFQQMINITESSFSSYIAYNNNLANFEYFYANGTIIPAWIESNSSGKLIMWVKINPSIPANSKLTIYLGFASKTTNLLSSSGTTGIGEAPQLSSTYAEYDDGASVFNSYWNFAGTSLPSGWVVGTGSAGSVTVNNGLSVYSDGGTQTTIQTTSAVVTPNSIVESWGETTGVNSYDNLGIGIVDANENSDTNGYFNFFATPTQFSTFYREGTSWINQLTGYTTYSNNVYYMVGIIRSGTSVTPEVNYNKYSTGTATFSSTANLYIIMNRLWLESTGDTGTVNYQYMRVRAYPPNGVMPSVAFGSVS